MTIDQPFSRAFEHRDELYVAALDEFATHGYEQASINAILARAGMSKGQFYHHFGGKENLYLALIGVLIERKRAALTEMMRPDDFEQDLFTIFERQIQYGLEFARMHPTIDRFALSVVRERGNPIYAVVLERFNFNNDALIAGLIERAYQAGELRVDIPLPFLKQLIAYMFTHANDIASLDDAASVEANLRYLMSVMRAGLSRQQ